LKENFGISAPEILPVEDQIRCNALIAEILSEIAENFSKRREPDIIELTLSMYDKLDKCVNIFLPSVEVACKKGCAACCRQQVLATDGEVLAAVQWIFTQGESFFRNLSNKLNCFERRVRSLYEKYSDLSGDKSTQAAEEYWERHIHCPFLEKSLCSIYPVRPIECRLFYVSKREGEICPYFTGLCGIFANLEIPLARAIEGAYLNLIYKKEAPIYATVFPLQVHYCISRIRRQS
jgi:Fe-S-cluster containining protein